MPRSSNGWTEVPSATAGSVFDLDKAEVLDGMRDQRARTMALLRTIPEPDWERIVVPRWRLREMAAHLLTTDEGALTGRLMTVGFNTPLESVPKIEAWNDRQVPRWADRPIPEIMRGLEKWARRMERLSGFVPQRVGRRAIPGPMGKVSLLWLGSMRIYDEWVHLEDVRRAYDMPSDDAPGATRPVARQLAAGLPIQTPPRVPEGSAGRVVLAFDDVDVPALGFDLGTRRFGFGLESGETRITGPTAAIAMIAAGRDDWRDTEGSGRLKIEGDRRSAETLLNALLLV